MTADRGRYPRPEYPVGHDGVHTSPIGGNDPIREHIQMALNTLPKLPILGYRKDGRPIFPIMGGEDSPEAAAQAAAAAAAAQAAADAAKNTGPVEATDEHGVGLGFPKETAVADMTPEQRANYWRAESKKQQARVPSNLAEIQAAAEKWAEFQRSQQTPADQQLAQVRAETEARVREEASRESAVALLRVSLHTRGKSDTEIDELLQFTSPDSFLNADKKVDTGKVSTYVDKIAPTGSGGGGGLPGQGRYEQQTADRAAAGKAEAERRGFKPADRTQSSLIPR